MSDIDSLYKVYNKLTNNKGAGRLSPQRDAIVRETHNEHLVRVSLEHDKPDFLSGKKTFIAIVVKVLDSNSGPQLGSTAEYIYNNLDVNKRKTLKHCLAMIPDVHDIVTPIPENITLSADNTNPKNYVPLTMASYFYAFNSLLQSFSVGSVIEVQFNDNELNEGTIVSVIEAMPVEELNKENLDKTGDGTTVSDADDTSGDGKQEDSTSSASGKCGDGSTTYPYVDCKSATLTSSGQTVTLHPVFWDDLEKLLNHIKETNGGYTISIGESIRSQERQLQIRKTRCPQWNGCISEQELKTERWSNIVNKCKCSDKTPVAATEGVYASNHLKGLAVDFKMDVSPCPAKSQDAAGYEACMQTSKVIQVLKRSISILKLSLRFKNLVGNSAEPWHWSYNGK